MNIKDNIPDSPDSPLAKNTSLGDLVDNWVLRYSNVIVLVLTVIGFILRIYPTSKIYLNPDECLHYLLAYQSNLYQVWLNSLTNAHPPLFFFILYFWSKIGSSELFLRLISVLAGTATIYFGYKWTEKSFEKKSGLVMAILLTFSPTLIALSQEVRGYSVLILSLVLTLYFLQLLLEKKQILFLFIYSIFLYCAILLHYSTSFLWVSLIIYFIYLIVRKEFNRKIIYLWSLLQLGAVGIYFFLYKTHLSQLSKSAIRQESIEGWLASSYLNIHHTNFKEILIFPFARTIDIFNYVFSLKILAPLLALIFIIAIIILIIKHRWRIGILLILPFLGNLFASVIGFYPYGGTRHTVYLIILAYAAITFLMGNWLKHRIYLLFISSVILIPLWLVFAQKPEQFIDPKNQKIEQMLQAKEFINRYLPKDETIFIDYQTSVMLGYYLERGKIASPAKFQDGFSVYDYGGYRLVSAQDWTFNAESFVKQFRKLLLNFPIDSFGAIWIIDAGWGWNLSSELHSAYPDLTFLKLITFGDNISIFQLPIEDVLKLKTSAEVAAKLNDKLLELAKITKNLKTVKYKAILWPLEQGYESYRPFLVDSSIPIIPLKKLYPMITQENKSLDDYLPALVFWILNDKKQHLQIFYYMNEMQNYIAAGYAFTLKYSDPEGIVALYEITRIEGSERITKPEN